MKKVLTEEFYGRKLEVEITESQRTDEIKFIPEAVKAAALSEMEHNIKEGTFDYDSIKFLLDISDSYCRYAGKWRLIELDYELMLRIAMWQGNFNREENLNRELFIEFFGVNDGNHFYEKWNGEIKRDIMLMMAYFKSNHQYGQIFCNMLMEQVNKYHQRNY